MKAKVIKNIIQKMKDNGYSKVAIIKDDYVDIKQIIVDEDNETVLICKGDEGRYFVDCNSINIVYNKF
ncbi:hypothetical protein PO367_03940 [Bacteroides ovatus]|uniref:hypothetical protein n=1 Tax=Bacteroides ovatus TaxID=28116 RepID=UPI0018974F5C|nr:hypothetical protein [Bacteroides ovatus]MCE8825908.1 hypothetical protein [Bacteroides fragilis]MDC2620907.1 hypothetical protein [Bacteroides ovatus]MDC2747231.1 hypothetical protein [Bacteroides ovatus]MDC2756876.1 hypothetical protein [Bacteroides ovatus]